MNKIRKLICISVSFLLVIFAGCSPRTEKNVSKSDSVRKITWDIYDPYSLFSSNWNSYSLLCEAIDGLNIQPEINIVRTNCDAVFAKCMLSKDYPDLITLCLSDSKLKKARSVCSYEILSGNDSLYSSIPEEIRRWHFGNSSPWYIPGGFFQSSENLNISAEGIYIYRDAYLEYGKNIQTVEELPDFLHSYSKAHNAVSEDTFRFGKRGFETLEHLCGFSPSDLPIIDVTNNDKRFSDLSDLLKQLSNYVINNSILPFKYNTLQKPIIFIGEAEAVRNWNFSSGKEEYVELDISFTKNSYLEKYSRYGTYATLITKGKNSLAAKELLSHLILPNISKMIMCGQENVAWILDEKSGETIFLNDFIQKMKNYDSYFLSEYGVSVFPYVSSYFPVYPGFSKTSASFRDILKERMMLCGDPTMPDSSDYRNTRNRLYDYYNSIIGAQ